MGWREVRWLLGRVSEGAVLWNGRNEMPIAPLMKCLLNRLWNDQLLATDPVACGITSFEENKCWTSNNGGMPLE